MRSAFVFGPYAIFAITFVTFVLRCRLGVRAQAVWAMALLACFSKFLGFAEFGGDAFVPELPAAVIWLWNWAQGGAVILCALGVLTFFWRFRLKVVLLPLVAWSLAAWGVLSGIRSPEVHEIEIACTDLPESLDGYRIVQLSDLHVSASARRERTSEIVRLSNEAKPDLVCITGDIVDGSPARRRGDAAPLKNLKARDGVYYVTGNHEFYNDYFEWARLYERWGLRLLNGRWVEPHPGLILGGTDDPCVSRVRRCSKPDAASAFAGSPEGFRVLLEHRPRRARRNAASANVRVQLSGHTHGGVMPLLDRVVARWNGGFAHGLESVGPGAYLYTSRGTGQWSGFPMRFLNDCEITVITLRKSP